MGRGFYYLFDIFVFERASAVEKRLQVFEQDLVQQLLLGYPALVGKRFILWGDKHSPGNTGNMWASFRANWNIT